MDIGAIQAGYEPIWGIEIDPQLAEVAEVNLKHKIYVESMIDFNWSKADRPDHLHISPPCQNASVANVKKGETGLDMAIAQSCCEALEYYQPDSFTLENVRGYQKFAAFQLIVDKLWSLGYWVNADVLNAADFGVPQDRDRLIVRAVKGGFPLPLAHKTERRGWYDAIADLIPSLPESSFAPWQLDRLPEMYKTLLTDSAKNPSRMATVREVDEPSFAICAGALNRPGHAPRAFIVHPTDQRTCPVVDSDRPLFTLTQNQGGNKLKAFVVNGTVRSWLDGGRVVALNSRCLARLQTLPDWYELPEKPSLAGKGIGNGVPCLFAEKILELS